jgi:hypothetical protein
MVNCCPKLSAYSGCSHSESLSVVVLIMRDVGRIQSSNRDGEYCERKVELRVGCEM